MKQTTDFKLVKGNFKAQEAKEVLFKLINSKINFHQLEAFSIRERNSENSAQTENRIEELQLIRKNLENFILQAEKENKTLTIDGTITINVLD
jgi:hypothetical protein